MMLKNANWRFDGDVPLSFDDHIDRSVPFYKNGHELICRISDFFLSNTNSSICYEIGCSTGELTKKLSMHNSTKDVQIIGIDPVYEMIELANNKCKGLNNVSFLCEDAIEVNFERSDFILAYYTFQFITPRVRQILMDKVYESLNWGGAFIMFEKVRGADARFQDINTALYTDFKLEQGFSEAEILNKTRSLKGVLEPFSTQGNLDLLRRSGFVDISTIMKYVCFEGFLAIK